MLDRFEGVRSIKVDNTKSGRTRNIPINDTLYKEINSLRNKKNSKSFVFFNEKTGKPLTTVKTAFKAACRWAGIVTGPFKENM